MGIIVKFVLKNIWEKKFRTFLIVFSVMLSSALFFASNAISGTMVKMYMDRVRQSVGTADIIVSANEKSPSSFLDASKSGKYSGLFDYAVGAIQGGGTFNPNQNESVNITIWGITPQDLITISSVKLDDSYIEKSADFYPFAGKKIIISSRTAQKYNLKLGSVFELKMNEVKHKFIVSGIAKPIGFFAEGGTTTIAVVPPDTLSSLYGVRGKSSLLLVKMKDPTQKQLGIEKLTEVYDRYTAKEPFSKEELAAESSRMSTPFMLMTIIVSFMSIFIIYSSFKVVTMERLPVIGTFRSIGATRKTTDFVLMVESTTYGIIGGAFGNILGIGILYIMATMSPDSVWDSGMKASIRFTPGQLLGTFILAVLLCFISSMLPIIKVSRIPIKEIVLNAIEKKKKRSRWRLIIGIILMILALGLPPVAPKDAAMLINTLCMMFSIFSVIMLIPYATALLLKGLEHLYRIILGNEAMLAAKNLRENKSILNSIALLTLGISSLLMINTISYSVMNELSSYFTKNAHFQIFMWDYAADRNLEKLLLSVDGVKDTFGIYQYDEIEIADTPDKLKGITGINRNKSLAFEDMDLVGNKVKLLDELDRGRNIIISNTANEKLHLKIDDLITLKMKRGERVYKVIGFFNTIDSVAGLIPARFLKTDMALRYYSQIYIKAYKDTDTVVNAIKKKFSKREPWVMSMKEIEKMNIQSNAQMFTILKGFSILTLFIGILGILNNLIISFIERKRSLAMFKSVGMSKKQTLKMIFMESLTGGVVGGLIGVISGLILISLVPYVLKSIDMSIPIHYSMSLILSSFLTGVAIMVLISISTAVKSSKLNIIEAIKYE